MKKGLVIGVIVVLAVGAFAVGALYAKNYIASKEAAKVKVVDQGTNVNTNSVIWSNNGTTGTGN